MPLNSRAKGAAGERELVDELNRLGLMARRTVQYCGKSGDAADIVISGTELHVECKRAEHVRLYEWIEQAKRDAHGRPYAVFTRRNRSEWHVVIPLELWARTSLHAIEAREHVAEVRDEAIRAQASVQPGS